MLGIIIISGQLKKCIFKSLIVRVWNHLKDWKEFTLSLPPCGVAALLVEACSSLFGHALAYIKACARVILISNRETSSCILRTMSCHIRCTYKNCMFVARP